MKGNSLRTLGALGQSIWLDYIRRDLMLAMRCRGAKARRTRRIIAPSSNSKNLP
jgi:hypothetical protein